MYFTLRRLLPAFLSTFVCVTLLSAQRIKITIPRPSSLTPVQRLNREGVEAVEKRRYEKAETLFNKAYLYDPTDPFTLTNLGYISELQGQADRAESFYKLAVEQGCYANIDLSTAKNLKNKPMIDALGTIKNLPMRVNRMNVMAMQLLSAGRSFEAESLLESALALDPANAFTLNDLGVANEALGDVEAALRYYDRSSAIRSKEPIVITINKAFRGKQISVVAAESAYGLRVRTQDRSPDELRASMLTLRGVTAVNRNDWTTARKSFVEAYSLDPHSAFTLNNLGYLSEHDGDLELAKSYYISASNAGDANRRVGLTTQTAYAAQELAPLAERSEQDVDAALVANGEKLRREPRTVGLKRRHADDREKPAVVPAQPVNKAPDTPAAPMTPR
jgi:Flp pilus assembly protein TadD